MGIAVDDANNKATITWTSKPGRVYTLESSLNLGRWIEVDDGIEGSDGETTSVEDDFGGDNTTERYYRVIEL